MKLIMLSAYPTTPVNNLLKAADAYREARDSWRDDVSRPGFYDPCGHAEEHAKERIVEAEEAFMKAFKTLVDIVND
jgi:hypothetical protein